MVYESGMTTSTDLKLLPGIDSDIYQGAGSRVSYQLKCIDSSKLVQDDGSNFAWADRVNNSTSSTTPLFLDRWRSANPQLNLMGYTINTESNPFGSMASPSSLYFRDSQHANGDFAGRPYGCEGANCLRLGYCSNNVNTYCVVTQQPGEEFCGSGGACLPIWKITPSQLSGALPSYYNPDYVLNNLFIKNKESIPSVVCSNNPRLEDDYCVIFPVVSNIKLYYGDSNTALASLSSYPRGIYRLEFNSKIDKEQQPLKNIVIDWGDGTSQTITGESAHPEDTRPHVVYHYYNDSNSGRDVKVRVTDNWYKFGDGEKIYGSLQTATTIQNLQTLQQN